MNPPDWLSMVTAVTSIIVAAATLVTLYLVWRELQNIERNQRATAAKDIAWGERELWTDALTDEQAAAFLAGHMTLDADFLESVSMTTSMALRGLLFFRQYENIYYQHDNDMLPDGLWEHWRESMKYTFKNPNIRKLFNQAHVGYSQSFKGFIRDELVPELLQEEGVFPSDSS
jgi:hypothetical protein